jgi:hypothetical protein
MERTMTTDTIDSSAQSRTEPPVEPSAAAPTGAAPVAPVPKENAKAAANGQASSLADASAGGPPAEVNAQLDEFEQQVGTFEQTYSEKAEQKNGLQKGMDWTRSWINRDAAGQGHGDDQWKNIANTQIEVGNIKRDLASGQATEQQAQARLEDLRQDFSTEADRVSQAQGRNAQAGKFVHQAGRVATVAAAGIGGTVASGGNVFVGGAAAVGAGNLYDAATVAAGQADKAMGNGPQDGQPSAFAPQLDTKQSFAGLAANAATGEKITGQDVFNATTNTALDFVGGAGAGNGVKAARTAIAATTTTSQAARAAAGASAKNTLLQSGATYTVQATSTAVNPWMTDEQKTQRMGQLTQDSLAQLPGQLAFGAVSGSAGVAFQPANKLMDAGVQVGVDALGNTGEAATTNLIQGKGPGLTDEQWINAAVGSTTGALHNVMQRPTAAEAATANGLNPYLGHAFEFLPRHGDEPTHVFGPTEAFDVPARAQTLPTTVWGRQTNDIWLGDANTAMRQQLGDDVSQANLYRAFMHPTRGEVRYLKTQLDQPYTFSPQYQRDVQQLLGDAGVRNVDPPLLRLVDETPTNVIPMRAEDHYALNLLRTASAAAVLGQDVPLGNESARATLHYAAPASEWMNQFLMGSGATKRMDPAQVAEALPEIFDRVDEATRPELYAFREEALANLGLSPSHGLDEAIAAQRAQGQTQGSVEGITQDHVFRANGRWANAIGSAHVFAVYQGNWRDTDNGQIAFDGERRWLVQDRYNWASPDFNGNPQALAAPAFPHQLTALLPPSYKRELSEDFGSFHVVTDAAFGHLQMLQGGAQPFWTLGLSEAEPVQSQWSSAQQPRAENE